MYVAVYIVLYMSYIAVLETCQQDEDEDLKGTVLKFVKRVQQRTNKLLYNKV